MTGATCALGGAAADALMAAGARVTLAGANGPALAELADGWPMRRAVTGPASRPSNGAPGSEADAAAMVSAAVTAHSRLDGVLVASGTNKVAPITDMPVADFDAVMDANVRGSCCASPDGMTRRRSETTASDSA